MRPDTWTPVRVSEPFSFVTVTLTTPAAWAGVTALRVVAFTKVTDAAGVLAKVTVVVAVKAEPVSVTVSPPSGVPLAGLTVVKTGAPLKVKPAVSVPEPFRFVTVTSTVPGFAGCQLLSIAVRGVTIQCR